MRPPNSKQREAIGQLAIDGLQIDVTEKSITMTHIPTALRVTHTWGPGCANETLRDARIAACIGLVDLVKRRSA